jgi:hypothetical protein
MNILQITVNSCNSFHFFLSRIGNFKSCLACCSHCGAEVAVPSGSTTGMFSHLQVKGLAQLFQGSHPTSRHSRLGSSYLQVSGLPSYSRGVIPLPGIRGWGPPTSRYQGCPIIPGESSHFPAFEVGVLLPPGIRAAQLFQVRHPTSWHSRVGSSHFQVSRLPSYSR